MKARHGPASPPFSANTYLWDLPTEWGEEDGGSPSPRVTSFFIGSDRSAAAPTGHCFAARVAGYSLVTRLRVWLPSLLVDCLTEWWILERLSGQTVESTTGPQL